MKYCAVSTKTESGDDYVFLCQYNKVSEVVDHIFDQMDEELAYVYTVSVDSGESAEKDDKIENAIWEKINSMEQD